MNSISKVIKCVFQQPFFLIFEKQLVVIEKSMCKKRFFLDFFHVFAEVPFFLNN